MYVIGLTGGIATGKSTLAGFLAKEGAIVIDADEVARDVIAPSSSVWKKIVNHFGEEILLKDNTINRRKLGNIVFFDLRELEALNRLTHPAIREAIKRRVARVRRATPLEQIVIIDAPLLAEAGLLPLVNVVVVVTASEKTRLQRLTKLGLSKTEARARIKAQTPDKERLQIADYIIENEKSLKELQAQASKLRKTLVSSERKGTKRN